jgi:quinol monooxygenase YgiN
MANEITVMAYFTAKEGREQELRDELLALVEPAAGEPGVLRFELYQDIENPLVLGALDTFADQAALDAHVASAPVSRFFNDVLPELAGPAEVTRMRRFG